MVRFSRPVKLILIKQSSGYREATSDGSKEKSLSSSLNLPECSTRPSPGAQQEQSGQPGGLGVLVRG